MKSKFKYILSTCLLILGMTACDINRLPETSISDATFWRSETDLIAATNYLYTFIPGFNTEDVWSDDAIGLTSNNISDGSRLAPSTDGNYTTPYQLIRAANNIIEKGPKAAATTSQAVIDRYIGEARFFRAWGYYSLVQKYGDVPLILKILDDTSPELTEPATQEKRFLTKSIKTLILLRQNCQPWQHSELPILAEFQTREHWRSKLVWLFLREHARNSTIMVIIKST